MITLDVSRQLDVTAEDGSDVPGMISSAGGLLGFLPTRPVDRIRISYARGWIASPHSTG
jgi:hypothetical protein